MKRWTTAILVLILFVGVFGCSQDGGEWTRQEEQTFLEGCKMGSPSDPTMETWCECMLERMKARGKTPRDVDDVNDRILAGRDLPAWVEFDVAACDEVAP